MLRSRLPRVLRLVVLFGLAAPASLSSSQTGQEHYVTTPDGVQLFVREVGTGAPVLVVPFATLVANDLAPLAADRRVLFYDMRGRGRSTPVRDSSRISIHHDVADLEAIRQHFGLTRMQLLGYSYLGSMVALYAARHPAFVERIVQVGPTPPRRPAPYIGRPIPGDTWVVDSAALTTLQERYRRGEYTGRPVDLCRDYNAVWGSRTFATPEHRQRHRPLVDPCTLDTEQLDQSQFWVRIHMAASGTEYDWRPLAARVQVPVLTIHGLLDRNAPFAGGREWVEALPNARLLAVPHAAHQVFTDVPDLFFPAVRAFLRGQWPPEAAPVRP